MAAQASTDSVETLHAERSITVSVDQEKCRLVRKTTPLAGTLRAELVRCGKRTCRCSSGERHGPYLYRRWREGRRQRRQYVKPADADQIRAALGEWRRLHPPARSARDVLAELRRLFRQLDLWGV